MLNMSDPFKSTKHQPACKVIMVMKIVLNLLSFQATFVFAYGNSQFKDLQEGILFNLICNL